MGSANKVPICLAGYNAADSPWVVPVPGLTGFAITSRRSHNLTEPIGRLELLSASVSHLLAMSRCHVWDMPSLVDLAANHDRPHHPCHLVGHGDARHTHRLTGQECNKPRIRSLRLVFGSTDQRCRTDHQQLSQISITHLGDVAKPVLATTGVLRRCEPEPSGELSTRTELPRISDRCRQRRCTDGADA